MKKFSAQLLTDAINFVVSQSKFIEVVRELEMSKYFTPKKVSSNPIKVENGTYTLSVYFDYISLRQGLQDYDVEAIVSWAVEKGFVLEDVKLIMRSNIEATDLTKLLSELDS